MTPALALFQHADDVRLRLQIHLQDLRRSARVFDTLRSQFTWRRQQPAWSFWPTVDDQNSDELPSQEADSQSGNGQVNSAVGCEITTLTQSLLKCDSRNVYGNVVGSVNRALLQFVLKQFRGNIVKAACALGVSRRRLRRLMKAHCIRVRVEVR